MKIILHVGAHKTASTHLQLALERSRDDLASHGIVLLLPEALRRHGLRLGDFLSIQPEDRSHGTAIRQAIAQVSRGVECLLISEENILGNAHQPAMIRQARLYPDAQSRLARLRTVLPDAPVTLAMGMRNPADFLVSAYSQRLMSGRLEPFEAFRAGLNPASLSWFDLVCRLRAALPNADSVLWTQEDYPRNAPAVLSALLGPQAGATVRLGAGRAHPGLTGPAHAALMAEAAVLAPQGEEAVRNRVRALRQKYALNKGNPPMALLDATTMALSAAAFAADLRQIAALPGVVMPGKG
ncbi:MAG: hypothetical protein ACXIVG_06050 [Pararhodobacter sp.]